MTRSTLTHLHALAHHTKQDGKLLLTHHIRLKNTTKDPNVRAAVKYRYKEPVVVNCRGIHRQLTAAAISIQIQAEPTLLSHPLLLSKPL